MGVRHLETFMKNNVPEGYVPVSLIRECYQFQKTHKEKPILIIDLMGILNAMIKDIEGMLCGGRYNKYRDQLENLFKKMSEHATLVFFEDGPVVEHKTSTWITRQSNKYKGCLEIMDMISRKVTLKEIAAIEHDSNGYTEIQRDTTVIILIEEIAEKYGEVIESFTRECDSEIARYAYNNPKVLAVIGDDTDFLIFAGHFRYFSLKQLDFNTLETMEYSRQALRYHLNLNDQQLIILSTLNGNDIIKYDQVSENFHKTLHFKYNKGHIRFPILAEYARELSQTGRLLKSNIQKYLKCVTIEQIEQSFELYNPIFNLNEDTEELLIYCRENHHIFTYSILLNKPKSSTSVYIDLRITNTFEAGTDFFRKIMGIILNHKKHLQIQCEIIIKRNHEQDYRSHFMEPIYVEDIPPLLELMKRTEFPEHDEIRFKLLKYLIGSLRLKNYNLKNIPKNYLIDVLTLVFLRHQKFIEQFEADLILLTIKHVETNTIPEDLETPQIVDERAFRVTFIYTKFFVNILRSFEPIGLNELTKMLNFDGVLFHRLYNNYITFKFDIKQLLGNELLPYRIYK